MNQQIKSGGGKLVESKKWDMLRSTGKQSCLQGFDAVGWAAGKVSGLQKTEWWCAGVVICLKRGADLHIAQLMPLPLTISCFSKIQVGFTFLVPAHPGSPGVRAVKRVCVCMGKLSGVVSRADMLRSIGTNINRLRCSSFYAP